MRSIAAWPRPRSRIRNDAVSLNFRIASGQLGCSIESPTLLLPLELPASSFQRPPFVDSLSDFRTVVVRCDNMSYPVFVPGEYFCRYEGWTLPEAGDTSQAWGRFKANRQYGGTIRSVSRTG